jgi:hypothetical protein
MSKRGDCCEKYKKKGKFCDDCPYVPSLGARERRELLDRYAKRSKKKGRKLGKKKKRKRG